MLLKITFFTSHRQTFVIATHIFSKFIYNQTYRYEEFHFCILYMSFRIYCMRAKDCIQNQLLAMMDEELLSYFHEVERDSIAAEEVARIYLERGRKEKDMIKMARGYDRLAQIFHPEKNIQFADSIIELTKNIDHITYPGLVYLTKSYNNYMIDNYNLG